MAVRVLFYLSTSVFLVSFLGLGVGGYVFALIIQAKKAEFQDFGMKVPHSTQLAFDLADFYWDFWWLIALLVILPSLLLTVALGIALRRRRGGRQA